MKRPKTVAKKPDYDPVKIRDISERVYRMRLGEKDAAHMVSEDKDGGKKLRGRAQPYDVLTRCYLEVLGIDL